MKKLTLQRLINRDSYLKEWRQKTSILLLAIGMQESTIMNALMGNLDNKKELMSVCQAQNLDYKYVSQLLNVK